MGIKIAPADEGQEGYKNGSYGILGSTHPIFRHLPGRCLCILLEKGPGGSGAAWTDRLFLRRYGGCVHLESADPRHGAVRRGGSQITVMAALALSLGIAIQNFPEGAIISMPLRAEGMNKAKAFAGGVLSGVVEPVGALLTILAAGLVVPALPYLLSFAAGAMLYVVVEELIPEMSQGKHSNVGTLTFALGFTLMMALDVALG